MTNLKTNFLGFEFDPSLVVASWILWVTADWMIDVIRNWAGWITTKSIHLNMRKWHKNPTQVWFSKEIWMINAVWLSWEWVDLAKETYDEYKSKEKKAPLIVSFFGSRIEDFWITASRLDESSADILEVNISCPNIDDEWWKPFAACPIDTKKVTDIVRKNTKKPIVIKLSPNVANIANIAKVCEEAWADGICAINTAWPWLLIDPYLRTPVLTNKTWWLSGPMIKSIALKAIWDISKSVNIPIIWTWGITTWRDAIEAIMCWASILWIWTAVYPRWIGVFQKIADEMREFMKEEWIKNLDEIRWCIK